MICISLACAHIMICKRFACVRILICNNLACVHIVICKSVACVNIIICKSVHVSHPALKAYRRCWPIWGVCSVQIPLYTVLCAVFSFQCAVCCVQCSLYNVQCAVFSVLCVMCNVKFQVCSVRCSVFSILSSVCSCQSAYNSFIIATFLCVHGWKDQQRPLWFASETSFHNRAAVGIYNPIYRHSLTRVQCSRS